MHVLCYMADNKNICMFYVITVTINTGSSFGGSPAITLSPICSNLWMSLHCFMLECVCRGVWWVCIMGVWGGCVGWLRSTVDTHSHFVAQTLKHFFFLFKPLRRAPSAIIQLSLCSILHQTKQKIQVLPSPAYTLIVTYNLYIWILHDVCTSCKIYYVKSSH